MKIATFNVNSIRRRLPIVLQWLEKNNPDVLCLQETKVQDSEFPLEPLHEAGYHVTFRGMKAYNGVATLSRQKPDKVVHGFCEGPDSEDFRILLTVIEGIPILNTYVPQGYLITSPKYAYKLAWFKRLRKFFDEYLDKNAPAVWLGDLNVAPTPLDVHAPERRTNDVDFHIDARNAYEEAVSWGFVDAFRHLYPDRVQYTYWDFFRNHFANNHGWRIDHIMVTAPLTKVLKEVVVDLEPRRSENASDHTVVCAEFSI